MVPNYIRKNISGWINYSCMVISHKMSESEMGYRGSKSDKIYKYPQSKEINLSVKEQRVEGSYFIYIYHNLMKLRCTLMGFERNYQFRIPTKQLNIKCTFPYQRKGTGATQSTLGLKH
uniref:hypothetical protein n=1 Tax=Cyathus jiayuguanensis TaxID=380660 RepID=UPI0023F0F8D0|nr:hypothetical protein P4C85_mgp20 [Cyathus jiayuguanensis]WDS46487.1 hypothetical protein [Cyathus jiayuguanensis]